MKTEWDYTELAQAYLKRPDYAGEAVDRILAAAGAAAGARVCDVGAGVGHLTIELAKRGLQVDAVEPNDAMRALGRQRTAAWDNVAWREGAGEATGQPSGVYALVAFGSSFNVVDRPRALAETRRIAAPGAWFACLWNHRDLTDPIQEGIERIIAERVDNYAYGQRRRDQTEFLRDCGYFDEIVKIDAPILHHMAVEDCVEAWRSHGTLSRQAGDRFGDIVAAIEAWLQAQTGATVAVPYTTVAWAARLKP